MTKKHIHKFEHTGGGYTIALKLYDDSYECKCGEKFDVETKVGKLHFGMPEFVSSSRQLKQLGKVKII